MPSKASIASRLATRRGLDENEAAVYVGVSPSYFRKLVADGIMPLPRLVGSRHIWDIDELDLAFRELPRAGSKDDQIAFARKNSWSDYE
jgi:excisionase family DNA binding protein